MPSPSITPCIQPNPDISGIGVRVSIYAQAILSLVPPLIFAIDGEITLEERLAINDIIITNELTACALLVSAVIQARTYGLSTYHAKIVLVLSWINVVPCLAAIHTDLLEKSKHPTDTDTDTSEADRKFRSRLTWKDRLTIFVIHMHYIAVAGLGLWVWSDVKSFGDQPECTPQTFLVIFGYNVLVTNTGLKKAALFLYGYIALVSVLPIALPLMQCLLRQLPLRRFLRLRKAERRTPSDIDSYTRNRINKRNHVLWSILVVLCIEVLLVASTEVLISRSKGLVLPGESQWTFGQSLAVFLIVFTPLVSTLGELQKGCKELRERRKGNRSRTMNLARHHSV